MTEPTEQMIAYFERRTREHIARVAHCLELLARDHPHGEALRERARVHDASKFSPQERLPYVWLTEYHRCRQCEEPFVYPPGMRERVDEAVHHHLTHNRHHPQFHAHPNAMTELDLIEMVCDWTAMAQEHGEGSALAWAQKTLGSRLKLDASRVELVFATIARLDAMLEQG